MKILPIFAVLKKWELSSAGSEHLPYKQRVTGSNPVVPTKSRIFRDFFMTFGYFIWELSSPCSEHSVYDRGRHWFETSSFRIEIQELIVLKL